MTKTWEQYIGERRVLIQEIDAILASERPAPAIILTSATGSEKTLKTKQPEPKERIRKELDYMDLWLEINQALRFYSVDTWKKALEKEWKERLDAPGKSAEEIRTKRRELSNVTKAVSKKRVEVYIKCDAIKSELAALLHCTKSGLNDIEAIDFIIEMGKTIDKKFTDVTRPIDERLSNQLEKINKKQNTIDILRQELGHESHLPPKKRTAKIANEKDYTTQFIEALQNGDKDKLKQLSQEEFKQYLHPDITERCYASLFPLHKQIDTKWRDISQQQNGKTTPHFS